MDSKTVQYKRTLRGSIGAGAGALFNGNGRRYYILEHKSASKYHRAGESQKIIVDQAELGRGEKCQVRFDGDTFPTVSRRHAAIVKDGDGWKIVHLSTTNSTLVNGQRVETERPLHNGDEIQLSVGGPRMGFIVPAGKQGLTSSLRLTERLNLFRRQALRPYKRAMAAMATCLVLVIAGFGGWTWHLDKGLKDQSAETAAINLRTDSNSKELIKINDKIAPLEKDVQTLRNKPRVVVVRPKDSGNGKIMSCYPYVYAITCYVLDEQGNYVVGRTKEGNVDYYAWSGTGFLLNNGYFVTAGHMVHCDEYDTKVVKVGDGEIKVYNTEGINTIVNTRYNAGLYKIRMVARSSSGDEIEMTYSFKNCPFRTGPSTIAQDVITDEQGRSWVVRTHYNEKNTDWACIKVNKSGGLPYASAFSKNMPPQTKLTILGFPQNMSKTQQGVVSPDLSEAITSRQGLEDGGWIRTSNENTDHGNSGGPVFAMHNGKLTVVGVLTGAMVGSDPSHRKGRIVPIGAVFN